MACLQPAAQTHRPADESDRLLRLPDSPTLRLPEEESQDAREHLEADCVPGLVMRNPGAMPGPDMPELPLQWHDRGGRTAYDMATDDVSDASVLFAEAAAVLLGKS